MWQSIHLSNLSQYLEFFALTCLAWLNTINCKASLSPLTEIFNLWKNKEFNSAQQKMKSTKTCCASQPLSIVSILLL